MLISVVITRQICKTDFSSCLDYRNVPSMTIFTSVDPGLYLGPEPQRDLLLVSKSLCGSGPKYISDMFGIRSVFHPQDISR